MTLAELKRWLNIPEDETSLDTALTELLARAIATVERELDWYFGEPRAVTELLSGRGTQRLWLRQPPVVTEVPPRPLVVEQRASTALWVPLVPLLDFEVERRLLLRVNTIWWRGHRNFRVTYYEGFEEMPGDIKQLVLDMVGAKVRAAGSSGELSSETIGDYSYSRSDVDNAAKGWGGLASLKGKYRRERI